MTTIDYQNVSLQARSGGVIRWAVGVTGCVIAGANLDRIYRDVTGPASTSPAGSRISAEVSHSVFVALYAAIAAGAFGRRRWVSAVAAGAVLALFDGLAREVGTAFAELSRRPDLASKWEMLTHGFFVQTWVGLTLCTYLLLPPFAAALVTRRARLELHTSPPRSSTGPLARIEAAILAWLPIDRQASFATSIASVAAVIEGLFYLASVPGMAARQAVPNHNVDSTLSVEPSALGSIWTIVAFALGAAWIGAGVHAARSNDRLTRGSSMRYLVALACTSVLWSARTRWSLLTLVARNEFGGGDLRLNAAWVGYFDGTVAEVMILIAFMLLARQASGIDPAADAIDPLTPHMQ